MKGVLYMSVISRYENYIQAITGTGKFASEYPTKETQVFQLSAYMFSRTQSIFKWDGLPDTIPQRILELYLQMNGNCAFYKYDDNLYVFTGGLGGERDVYYMPTIYTISNPALKLSVNAEIGVDCVVMPNDSMYMGLYPLHTRYARNMVDTELSMKLANINSRIQSLISAQDDSTKKSADKYIEDIINGELSVIAEAKFFEDLKVSPYSNNAHGVITDLIELMQYFKASWYNEIGLNANYNMKRESINAGESQLNNDALLPFIDDMLNTRKIYAEKVNDMFGTSLSVDYNSAWKDNEIEIEAEQETLNDENTNNGGVENENDQSE